MDVKCKVCTETTAKNDGGKGENIWKNETQRHKNTHS